MHRGFGRATTKQLRHYVVPTLADDTLDLEVIHGGFNEDLVYKNVLSTDGIVDAILVIGKLCKFHGGNSILISSLRCRKNEFQNNNIIEANKLLRSAGD